MNNFKVIRKAYGCKSVDLARTLNLKSSSTITTIENGKSHPSCDLLGKYAALFGVTTDWLLEKTDIAYTEDSVSYAEEVAQKELSQYRTTQDLIRNLPTFYKDINKRRDCYSLEIRANLAFILSSSYNRHLAYQNSYQSGDNGGPSNILNLALSFITNRKYLKYVDSPLKKRDEELIKSFWLLVVRKDTQPIFSVQSILAQQE